MIVLIPLSVRRKYVAQQYPLKDVNRYAKAAYNRMGVWRSSIIAVIALLVFVAIVVAIDAALKPQLGGLGLLGVGVVLALVPAALWLVFFYAQDRVEPEPVGQVARIFVIGLALAGAIGIPLTNNIFRVQDWLYRDTTSTVFGALLIGAIEIFILYAVVRYFIFDSAEFDERTDGVVYGTAAGLGYATAINLQFILTSGGSGIGGSEVYMAELALAYAAFGGVIGYFLGHAKLERDPLWWLPVGFIITVILSALFFVLRGQLETGAITRGAASALPSITGLVLAGVLAVIVTAIVGVLVNRDVQRSVKGALPAVAGDPTVGDKQANWAVIVVFVVLLLVGVLGWNGAVNGTTAFNNGGVQGAYPAYYGKVNDSKAALHVSDRVGSGAEFLVTTKELKSGQDLRAVSSLLAAERGDGNLIYKMIDSRPVVINGKQAQMQQFAYVESNGLTGAVPRVVQGADYIFMQGGKTVIATLLATPDTVGEVEPLFSNFVNSLQF
jgi:RsiW-degrading membrane proteinase PrsW (M82 family)